MGNMMKWAGFLLAVCLLATCFLATATARAEGEAASDWFVTDQGRVRLIAATSDPRGANTVTLGLEFRLAPHWKIYWRSAGDAGYPPHLDWAGSSNLVAADLAWPAPQRFSVLGLETIGYEGTVVLPITAHLAAPGTATSFRLDLDYLTCAEICIPYHATLALDLPAAHDAQGFPDLIALYQAQVPGDGAGAGLKLLGASVSAGALHLRIASTTPLDHPDVFVEGPSSVAFGVPTLEGPDVLRVPVEGDIAKLVGAEVTVTLIDGARLLQGTVTPAEAPPPRNLNFMAGFIALMPMMALALLGGFILNFMPCVLPVLSLKLLSVLGPAREGSRVRFLATSAGIVLSFLALALVLIALKSAGFAIGWGVQFQQPLFLVALIVALTLFAANLWDRFEIPLPSFLGSLAGPKRGGSLLGDVATGAFATILATPCSAPFLGTAIGFAFTAGPVEILAIFLALGVGLAAPFLLVAAVPALVGWLPRPGRWMIVLRRLLGVGLAASALWLIMVLAAEIGVKGALLIAVLMAVAAAVMGGGRLRPVIVGALMGAAFIVPAFAPPPSARLISDPLWHKLDRAAIAGEVAEGHVVFVDITADWCINCLVNERLVLDTAPVHARLEASEVMAMRGDWTRSDPAIEGFLRDFGRYGIPFNAVFGPGAPQGLALPEVLSEASVLAALDRASAR
ncbi:MAG TPA: protein-disulfide reductase DsbD domain-containing protein [Stellaceae bacterium]|nr:protein-disulfide reductase DsbD domain-containing protein [Stellaceae bacterium]